MKILPGNKIVDNYRGNLSISTLDTSVIIKNSQGDNILPGNRIIPVGDYLIEATPIEGKVLKVLTINNQPIINNQFNLKFGQDVSIYAESEEYVAPTSSPLSDFVFDGNTIIKYIGNDEEVILPNSYSLQTTTGTVVTPGNRVYINPPSLWGSSLAGASRWNYINSITISDGTLTKTFSDYNSMRNAMLNEFDTTVNKYLVSFDFKNYNARTIFNSSSSYNFIQYPFTIYYNNQTIVWDTYSGSSQPLEDGSSLTMLTWFRESYIPNTECPCGGVSTEMTISTPVVGDDYIVEELGNQSFKSNTNITKVIFSDNILRINDSSFNYCYSLKEAILNDKLQHIGTYAFASCYALESINIPAAVTSIGGYPFDGCSSLKFISVNSANEYYSDGDGNNVLIELSTDTLLQGCLNSIIPNTVKIIYSYAFQGIPITSITIPEGVTNMGSYVFRDCNSLVRVSFPQSLIDIAYTPFFYCDAIEEITFNSIEPPTMHSDLFYGVSTSKVKIYVPESSLNLYKNNAYLSQYSNIIYPIQ